MIIAIDPGKAGGIAFDEPEVQAFKMPQTEGDLIDFFDKHVFSPGTDLGGLVCFMEKVGGFVGMRKKYILCPQCRYSVPVQTADPGSAMFKFGYGNGLLMGVILSRKIPVELVTPQKWMKALSLGTKGGMPKQQWKNKLKAKAQQLYPNLKVTLNTCDALLILHYARLLEYNNQIPALHQGGQSTGYSKKAYEAYEGKPSPMGQTEMNLGDRNDLPF